MKFISAFFLRFCICFSALFVLTIPFPYYILPDTGSFIAPFFVPVVRWIGGQVLSIHRVFIPQIISDSTGMYIFSLLILGTALVLAGIWLWRWPSTQKDYKIRYWFYTAISYYLSLQLFTYGFSKLFKVQFYHPEPNILFTHVGDLGRDILYWTTMGSSRAYTMFSGIIEIIPALMLLFRRTRYAGAVIAFMVMLNVVMINFGFDISVKIFSLYLLLLSVIAGWPRLRFVNSNTSSLAPTWRPVWQSRPQRLFYAVIKSVIICLILFEGLFMYARSGNFNDDKAERPPLHGAWEVTLFVRNRDTLPPLTTDTLRFRRIFIHRQGYMIIQKMDDKMHDYLLITDPASHSITLHGNGLPQTVWAYHLSHHDSLLNISGMFRGDSLRIQARKIDLTRLPLFQKGFHWTIDRGN